jgi:hypothetical protein
MSLLESVFLLYQMPWQLAGLKEQSFENEGGTISYSSYDVEYKRRASGNRSWAADFFKIYELEILNGGFLKIRF